MLGQDYKHTTQTGFQDRRGFGKGGRSRGKVAVDAADSEEAYTQNYGEEWNDEWGYYEGDGGSPSYYGGDDDEWDETDEFDAQAAYYQYKESAEDPGVPLQDVDTYDEVYAAYVDARRGFSDLKLACGFLPVVALNDPAAGNLAPRCDFAPILQRQEGQIQGQKMVQGGNPALTGTPKPR